MTDLDRQADDFTHLSADDADLLERVVIHNDLAKLSPAERVSYYHLMCRMTRTNPINRPFEYLELDGKLTLYVTKRGTADIRAANRVSIDLIDAKRVEDVYVVTARATMPDGRTDVSTGAVPIVEQGLELDEWGQKIWLKSQNGKSYPKRSDKWVAMAPENFANAVMKAETKAKRRVTLDAVGLGLMDESELETIPANRMQRVTPDGEIVEAAQGRRQGPPRQERAALGPGSSQKAADVLPRDDRRANEPVPINRPQGRPQAAQRPQNDDPAEMEKRAAIRAAQKLDAIARAADWDRQDLLAYAGNQYETADLDDLTVDQLTEMTEDIRAGLQNDPAELRKIRDEMRQERTGAAVVEEGGAES